MKRPLTYFGNPLLRKRCKEIEAITPEIKKLAADLIETMIAAKGAAIAAPQIGVPLRMFAIHYTDTDDEGMPVMGDPEIYINPQIVGTSEEEVVIEEGCLSIPEVRVPVQRPEVIEVESLRLDGSVRKEKVGGWRARAILHENDHLNGVLMIDRTPKSVRKKIDPDLRALKKKFSHQ